MKISTWGLSKSLITYDSSKVENSIWRADLGTVNINSSANGKGSFDKSLWVLSDKRRLDKCLWPPIVYKSTVVKFNYSIRIQRLQRLPSTHFHPNQVIFYIYVRHIRFRIFEWRFLTSDLENPRVIIFIPVKWIFRCWSTILDPLLWVPRFQVKIHDRWFRNTPSDNFYSNQVNFYILARHTRMEKYIHVHEENFWGKFSIKI